MPKLPIVLNTPPRDVAVRVDVLIERARRTDREGRVAEIALPIDEMVATAVSAATFEEFTFPIR